MVISSMNISNSNISQQNVTLVKISFIVFLASNHSKLCLYMKSNPAQLQANKTRIKKTAKVHTQNGEE